MDFAGRRPAGTRRLARLTRVPSSWKLPTITSANGCEDVVEMKKLLLLSGLVWALLVAVPGQSRAQLGGGLLGGGTVGGTLQNLRNRMTNRNPAIQYDPSVLTPGTPRDEVLAVFGNPNGSQNVNGVQQDVFAFYPNGDKYVDPQ